MNLLTSPSLGAQRLSGFLNHRKGRHTARPWQNNYNNNGVSPAWCDWTNLFSYLPLACSYPLYQSLWFPLLFSICHTPHNPASSANFVQWWSEHQSHRWGAETVQMASWVLLSCLCCLCDLESVTSLPYLQMRGVKQSAVVNKWHVCCPTPPPCTLQILLIALLDPSISPKTVLLKATASKLHWSLRDASRAGVYLLSLDWKNSIVPLRIWESVS